MSGGGIQDGAYGYGQNVAPTASFVGHQPVWMKGLMGALTGDKTYGKNAPMIHQALAGFMKPQQPQQPPQMMPQMRPPMMGAPQVAQLGAPQMPMGQPFAAPQQIPSMAPWMTGRM